MKIILQCKKAIPFTLSEQEIRSMVDPQVMEAIKAREAKPLLKAYVLAAEGNAYPEVITESGERKGGVVVWTKNAIKDVAKAVKIGITKLFINHTEYRNAAEHSDKLAYEQAKGGANRQANAYVAASEIREYGGKTYNIIVAYFPESSRNQADDLDAVSMEVEYEAKEGAQGSTIVEKVLNVFGIALLGRDKRPAFDEAVSVGVAHAQLAYYFQDDQTNARAVRQPEETPPERKKMSLEDASFEDLRRELVDRRKAEFWQLYDIDKLKGKPITLKDGSVQYIGGDKKFQEEYLTMRENIRKEIDQEYQQEREALQAKIKELEPLATEIKTYKAIPILEQKIEELKLSPAVAAAVKRNQSKFVPGEDLDKDAEQFIAKIKEDVDFYAKQFGAKIEEGPELGGAPDKAEAPKEEKGILGVDDVD